MLLISLVAAVVAGAWLRGLLIVLWDRRAVPHLGGPLPAPGADAPLVSVIVPARNEAANIEPCVRSLLAQQWPRFELLVVDDRSDDGTGEILATIAREDPRLLVVPGAELPDGWLGKANACAQGAARAKGALLLFTDADSVHQPDCLAHAVGALDRLGGDLFTVIPHAQCVGFAEKLLQPAILGGLFTLESLSNLNADRARYPLGNGQFLLFRRSSYDRIGGHAAVKDRVVEDLALARLVVDAGLKLRLAFARDVVRVRMYTRFSEIWWGYAKSMAATPAIYFGLEGSLVKRLAGLVMMGANSLLILSLGVAPVVALGVGGWTSVAGAVGLSAAVVQRAVQNREIFGIAPAWALTLPVGHVVSAAINAHSGWRAFTRAGPRWKGRTYPAAR